MSIRYQISQFNSPGLSLVDSPSKSQSNIKLKIESDTFIVTEIMYTEVSSNYSSIRRDRYNRVK